jgi:hypothetical protein
MSEGFISVRLQCWRSTEVLVSHKIHLATVRVFRPIPSRQLPSLTALPARDIHFGDLVPVIFFELSVVEKVSVAVKGEEDSCHDWGAISGASAY